MADREQPDMSKYKEPVETELSEVVEVNGIKFIRPKEFPQSNSLINEKQAPTTPDSPVPD